MNLKVTLAILALLGMSEAAWTSAGTVSNTLLGTKSDKKEYEFRSEAKIFGHVKRVKVCQDVFSSKLEWDMGNICEAGS